MGSGRVHREVPHWAEREVIAGGGVGGASEGFGEGGGPLRPASASLVAGHRAHGPELAREKFLEPTGEGLGDVELAGLRAGIDGGDQVIEVARIAVQQGLKALPARFPTPLGVGGPVQFREMKQIARRFREVVGGFQGCDRPGEDGLAVVAFEIWPRPGVPAALLARGGVGEWCRSVGIVVSAEPARGLCPRPWPALVDRFTVWRQGAAAIWLQPHGRARVLTDREARGTRPWVSPPPEPRSKAAPAGLPPAARDGPGGG